MIKLLIGGSPCTNWSIAQRKNRETTASGIGWELFLNYVIAKEKFKPDFFLYENNKSAAPAIKEQISIELGVPLMHIDSALVSAQTRKRFYAFNWTVPQPEDRGILLRDILEDGIPDRDKAHCFKHQVGNVRDYFQKNHTQVAFVPVGVGFRNRRDEDGTLSRRFETHGQPKANALTTVQTDSMVAEPLNVTEDGKAQCLRATYYKDGIRNLVGNTVDRRTCVAEPLRVGGMPRPSGEVSQSQGLRIYSADGKAVSLKANAGGAGGKTGLYAIPEASGPIRVANIGKGRQGERIYDAGGKSCAVKQQGGGPGGHAQGLYATPCEGPQGEILVKIEPPIYWVEGEQIEIKGRKYPIKLPDGAYLIRKLTVTECCRLQTLPDDYCRAVPDSRAYAALGAGWTAEVIIHILQGALKDVPRDEEIIVLSMYDGIATGRHRPLLPRPDGLHQYPLLRIRDRPIRHQGGKGQLPRHHRMWGRFRPQKRGMAAPRITRKENQTMFDEKECCGTCKWHRHEDITDGWVCVNDESEYCTDFTPYDHCCEEWEGRR